MLLALSSEPDWNRWLSLASFVVAVLALAVSWHNGRSARRALALSEKQEERRASRLAVTLNDAASWHRPDMPRLVGMKILAVNPTDRDGTLVNADLHVTYTLRTGYVTTVKVPHETTGDALPTGITTLDLPVRLQANGAVAGWLTFQLPAGLFPDGAGIDRYDAVIQDSRDITATVSASVLREVNHDQAPASEAAH